MRIVRHTGLSPRRSQSDFQSPNLPTNLFLSSSTATEPTQSTTSSLPAALLEELHADLAANAIIGRGCRGQLAREVVNSGVDQ